MGQYVRFHRFKQLGRFNTKFFWKLQIAHDKVPFPAPAVIENKGLKLEHPNLLIDVTAQESLFCSRPVTPTVDLKLTNIFHPAVQAPFSWFGQKQIGARHYSSMAGSINGPQRLDTATRQSLLQKILAEQKALQARLELLGELQEQLEELDYLESMLHGRGVIEMYEKDNPSDFKFFTYHGDPNVSKKERQEAWTKFLTTNPKGREMFSETGGGRSEEQVARDLAEFCESSLIALTNAAKNGPSRGSRDESRNDEDGRASRVKGEDDVHDVTRAAPMKKSQLKTEPSTKHPA